MLAFYLFRISEIFNDCLNFLKHLGGWSGGFTILRHTSQIIPLENVHSLQLDGVTVCRPVLGRHTRTAVSVGVKYLVILWCDE